MASAGGTVVVSYTREGAVDRITQTDPEDSHDARSA
jgi:hypothetical protein